MNELEEVKQFCLDNIILSGCRPATIDGTLMYLKNFASKTHMSQEKICEKFGVSTVALRNNVKKIRLSKEYPKIKEMLKNPFIDSVRNRL